MFPTAVCILSLVLRPVLANNWPWVPSSTQADASTSSVPTAISSAAVVEAASSIRSEPPSVSFSASSSASASASGVALNSTSPSSASIAEPTPTGPAKKMAKRGISYPSDNNPQDFLNINQTRSVISWVYDWAIAPPLDLEYTGIEYVPMQWGAGNIENLSSIMATTGLKTLLAFNEPDFVEQANMDPAYAANLWMEYIEPLKETGVRLGGPAVTASGGSWLREFVEECSECTIDFLPLHWYGEGSAGFYDYLWSIHAEYPDYPIWITEYADTRLNADDVLTFMNETAIYLEGLEWVERYAWFGYFRPEEDAAYNMLGRNGGLNELGELYIGAASVEESGPATHVPIPPGGPPPTYAPAVVGTNVAVPTFGSESSSSSLGAPGTLSLSGILVLGAMILCM